MFDTELSYIKDKRIRESARILLENLPEYFYKVPASSSGKYHPDFASGEGGLVRHSKVAAKMAYELYQITPYDRLFSSLEKDVMILSLLIHDGLKKGKVEEAYTRFDHPNLIAEFVLENKDKTALTDKEVAFINHVVKSHMGKWNTNNYSKVILDVPQDRFQYFVHMCDYLASKKFINVKFKEMEIEE